MATDKNNPKFKPKMRKKHKSILSDNTLMEINILKELKTLKVNNHLSKLITYTNENNGTTSVTKEKYRKFLVKDF